MTVGQLAKKCGFKVITKNADLEREASGGFCGDLLSWALGHAKQGSVWITVIGNANTIAVALLSKVSCVILADGAVLDDDAKMRAEENGIAVLESEKSAFEIAVSVGKTLDL